MAVFTGFCRATVSFADMRSLTQTVSGKLEGEEVVDEFIRGGETHRATAALTKLQEQRDRV